MNRPTKVTRAREEKGFVAHCNLNIGRNLANITGNCWKVKGRAQNWLQHELLFCPKKLRHKFSIPKNGCGSYFFVQKIISKKENPDRSPGYNEELFSTEDNLFPSKQMYGKEMVSANSYFLVIHHKEIKSSRKHLSTPYLYVVRKKRAIFI